MQIVENKALLLKLRRPERVLATIPRSKQLADGMVLVYWGLDESQVLKNSRRQEGTIANRKALQLAGNIYAIRTPADYRLVSHAPS